MTGTEQWMGGAALVGILAGCWNKIKYLSWRLVNIFIVRARLSNEADRAFSYYCWTEMKRTPFGEKLFEGCNEFVQSVDRYQTIGYEKIGYDPQVFWLGWRPILVSHGVKGLEGGAHTGFQVDITFIRGMFDLDDLIIKALDKVNEVKHSGDKGSRFSVKRVYGNGRVNYQGIEAGGINYKQNSPNDSPVEREESRYADRRYLKWDRSDLGLARGSNDPFSCLAYPPHVMEVVERCQRWLASERWYKEKEILWRFGILLYGTPGSGKSSFVKAVGRLLNLPAISYDLASFNNKDFEAEWGRMMNSTPCIALLEDVDAVFDGRENRLGEEGGGLTFDCLLNCISGIKDANGVLTIVTTNRPECLDEALGRPDGDKGVSTRPGRIDVAVELSLMDEECRYRLAQRILKDCPEKIEELVAQGEGFTGAQFTELCSKIALEHYWSDKGPRVQTNGVYASERTVGTDYQRLLYNIFGRPDEAVRDD